MTRKRAVALRYQSSHDQAPKVVAKGVGDVAEALIHAAKQHDVRLWSDTQLVDALMRLDIGDVIPSELYEAVALILAYIYGKADG